MTNTEFAATLRELASVYEQNDAAPQATLKIYAFDKAGAVAAIKAIGGRFNKPKPDDDQTFVVYVSDRIPGVEVCVYRSSVCKRIVTWDCTPLLSVDEQAEIEAAGGMEEKHA